MSIAGLCQSACASPEYAAAVAKHGATCEANGRVLSADDIAQTCTRAFVSQWACAAGMAPGDRKRKRQQKKEQRASYAESLSKTYGFAITPQMIGMGIFAVAIAFFGGIPMLLLCVASVVFQHLFAEQFFNSDGLMQAAASLGVA